jgi:uncharacterized membrane protein
MNFWLKSLLSKGSRTNEAQISIIGTIDPIFLASSADNQVLVTGFSGEDLNNRVLVWHRQTGKLISSLSSDNDSRPNVFARYATALSADGQLMVTIPQQGDESGRVYVWRLPKAS